MIVFHPGDENITFEEVNSFVYPDEILETEVSSLTQSGEILETENKSSTPVKLMEVRNNNGEVTLYKCKSKTTKHFRTKYPILIHCTYFCTLVLNSQHFLPSVYKIRELHVYKSGNTLPLLAK